MGSRHLQKPEPNKKTSEPQNWGLSYMMEMTRVLTFPCMIFTPLIFMLASCRHAVTWLAVGLDFTSLQPLSVQTKHCLPWLVSLVPTVSGLCLKCHILLIQLYVSQPHTFIVKINIFLEEERNIMSATFIYSSCQMVLWGFSFFSKIS